MYSNKKKQKVLSHKLFHFQSSVVPNCYSTAQGPTWSLGYYILEELLDQLNLQISAIYEMEAERV